MNAKTAGTLNPPIAIPLQSIGRDALPENGKEHKPNVEPSIEMIQSGLPLLSDSLEERENSTFESHGASSTCPECGSLMLQTGSCHTCPNCLYNEGCG